MLEILQFIFSSFWVYCGFVVLFVIALAIVNSILNLINRLIRHRNIALQGYPPPHCDADGESINLTGDAE